MHGVTGKTTAISGLDKASSKVMLLVTMTGVAPISLYMPVPALPVLAIDFDRDISIAQMTVSLYMVGLACSQIVMGPLSDRFAPRHSIERMIWFGLALQSAGALLNLASGIAGLNHMPSWLFSTQMLLMVGNAFVMANSSAGAISIRPQAAGTASGAMGFLQMGLGSLFSQFGAWLGGHFPTPVPTNIAIVALSVACARPWCSWCRGAGGRGRDGVVVAQCAAPITASSSRTRGPITPEVHDFARRFNREQ
jgi:MFS family permease